MTGHRTFPTQRFPLRKLSLAVALGLAGMAAGSPWTTAQADGASQQPAASHYQIPAQPLADALNAFISASDWQVGYPAALAQGLKSSPVNGDYTPLQALQHLLAGTGLSYRLTAANSVTLEKIPLSQSSETTLATVTVTGARTQNAVDPYDTSYAKANASTATKTATPLLETPVSIQVVPRAVIDDQQAIRLDEVTKNVSSVQPMRQLGVLFDNFVIRGFTTSPFNVYRDGLRLGQQSFETANLDQVEILKGPPSTLFGRSAPGGLVNMVTKKPLFKPYYAITQQFGSYDLYRTSLDATGALTDDNSLAYRLNFSYMESGSFRDYVDRDRIFVAPQLTWKPNDSLEVNFGYEYKKDHITGDRGIPAVGNRPANLPISRFIGEPSFSGQQAESHLAHLTWNYSFNDAWKVQQRFVANILDTFNSNIVPLSLRADNRTINRGLFNGLTKRTTYTQDINLNGKFSTFGLGHNVLLGFDYYRFEQSRDASFLSGLLPAYSYIPPIDMYNPIYGTVNLPANLPVNNFVTENQEWFGLYFQDQLDLTDNLHFLFSGRHDWATTQSGFSTVSSPALTSVSAEKFSPRLGLVYQPVQWLSFFANWTEALGGNNGRSASGQPFSPELAEQFEGGIKTEFFDGRLTASLAAYELTKSNILTADISTPDPSDSVAIGRARSQGIEFDAAGQLTDRLKLIGSYSYTDTEILKDYYGNQGHRLPNAPENSGSLWLNYELPQGFKFGTGTYIAGKRQANAANNWQLPGYVRWDAMAAYQWKVGKSRMTAQVNVNNILDKRYYAFADEFGNPRFDAMPGEPLTVLGSIKLEY